MAIEEMKLLSVVGKEKYIDDFIANYLIDSGIQPEDAIRVFNKGWKLSYFNYDNTARGLKKQCDEAMKLLEIEDVEHVEKIELDESIEELSEHLNSVYESISSLKKYIVHKNNLLNNLTEKIEILKHLEKINVNLKDLYNLRYMRFRFGRIDKTNYQNHYSDFQNLKAIVFEVEEDGNDLWIIYLTTDNYSKEVDSFFNIAKFERIWLPSEIEDIPSEYLERAKDRLSKVKSELEDAISSFNIAKKEYKIQLSKMYEKINLYIKISNVKKYMAHDNKGNFYIVGWMPTSNLEQMIPRLDKEKDIDYVVKSHMEVPNIPPTNMKNNKFFKPFEEIVKMYGLPNYTEIDPTKFVAITAFLMFGFMFGDVGHGLILLIVAIILSRRKSKLGPILVFGGISSIIFGFLYGSIFGKEDIIPQILISPMEDIQTMLIAGIGIGVVLILISMILNIINAIKNKNKAKIFFDSNGIAGIVFYITALATIIGFAINEKINISIGIVIILIVIPLILILFKDKLEGWMDKKKQKTKISFVEKFFELFEMLLSFISNTISFVRLAAFAINHVGLCMAVYILSDMLGGVGSIVVNIIGNIIIIALEGLIVSIQVLRLEYYELFSRFYSGDGREYVPINNEKEEI